MMQSKVLFLILAAFVLMAISGCGRQTPTGVEPEPLPGDLSQEGDGRVDIYDLSLLAELMPTGQSPWDHSYANARVLAADVNHDGMSLGAADMQTLLNFICDIQPLDNPPRHPRVLSFRADTLLVRGSFGFFTLQYRGVVQPAPPNDWMSYRIRTDSVSEVTTVSSRSSASGLYEFKGAMIVSDAPICDVDLCTTDGAAVDIIWDPPRNWLQRCYPDPVRGSTTIPFSLAETGPYRILISNERGVPVAELYGRAQKGSNEAVWDGRGFPEGMYYYRLEINEFNYTRRLYLLPM